MRPQKLLASVSRLKASYSLFRQTCLKTTLFHFTILKGIYLTNTLGERKSSKLTSGYETTTLSLSWRRTFIFPPWLLEEGWTLLSVVWYVNFLRLWKYFYDQSMWMFRIALCRLLICFSTTHKRFQHQTAFASREERNIRSLYYPVDQMFNDSIWYFICEEVICFCSYGVWKCLKARGDLRCSLHNLCRYCWELTSNPGSWISDITQPLLRKCNFCCLKE